MWNGVRVLTQWKQHDLPRASTNLIEGRSTGRMMGKKATRGMTSRWLNRLGRRDLLAAFLAIVVSCMTMWVAAWVTAWALPVHAQQPTGRVAVVEVDDQNFPVVSLLMDVADPNGAPVAGLAPANFIIQEDGRAAAVQIVTTDTSQPLALLLALDGR